MSYGIRVKNPLMLRVKVQVLEGEKIIRDATIEPSRTRFIELDKPGDYDVRAMIVDNVSSNSYDEIGPGDLKVIDHEEVMAAQMKPVLISKTVLLQVPTNQKTARYWRDVVIWQVAPGAIGELMAVEVEPRPEVKWRLKIMKRGDGRFGGDITQLRGATTFKGVHVTGGMIIKLQAKSLAGSSITVSGRISGWQTEVSETSSPDKVEIEPLDDEEEVPVRSLADMFEDLKEEEVKV
jgi:hypothetical protein